MFNLTPLLASPVLQKPSEGLFQTSSEVHGRKPPQSSQLAGIEQLLPRTLGSGRVPTDLSPKSYHFGNKSGDLTQRMGFAGANVYGFRSLVAPKQQLARPRQVFHVEELARRATVPPQSDLVCFVHACLKKLVDERRNHVRRRRVERISRAVEIARNRCNVRGPVLSIVRQTQGKPGQLCNSVGLTRRLHSACHQRVWAHRLATVLWVDAGTAEIEQSSHPYLPRAMDEIGFYGEGFVYEFCRGKGICQDPPDFARSNDDDIGPGSLEKVFHRTAIGEIQLRPSRLYKLHAL